MNRKIKLFILLILSMSVYFIYQKTKNSTYRITSIGDNISIGINSYGIKEYSYIDYYKDYIMKEKNKVLLNNKYSNQYITINSILEKIKNTQSIKKDLYDTNILILTIGYNDLVYNLSIDNNINEYKLNIILNKISKDYNNLINEIRKYYKEKIIVVGYYKANKEDVYLNIGLQRLNNILKNNEEIIYIDTYNLLNNNRKYFSNPKSIYPNRKGYIEISNKIIEKTLEK